MPKLGYTIAAVVMVLASVAVAATPDTKPGPAPECKPIEDSLADLASLLPVAPKMIKVADAFGINVIVADMKEQLGDEVHRAEGDAARWRILEREGLSRLDGFNFSEDVIEKLTAVRRAAMN